MIVEQLNSFDNVKLSLKCPSVPTMQSTNPSNLGGNIFSLVQGMSNIFSQQLEELCIHLPRLNS